MDPKTAGAYEYWGINTAEDHQGRPCPCTVMHCNALHCPMLHGCCTALHSPFPGSPNPTHPSPISQVHSHAPYPLLCPPTLGLPRDAKTKLSLSCLASAAMPRFLSSAPLLPLVSPLPAYTPVPRAMCKHIPRTQLLCWPPSPCFHSLHSPTLFLPTPCPMREGANTHPSLNCHATTLLLSSTSSSS